MNKKENQADCTFYLKGRAEVAKLNNLSSSGRATETRSFTVDSVSYTEYPPQYSLDFIKSKGASRLRENGFELLRTLKEDGEFVQCLRIKDFFHWGYGRRLGLRLARSWPVGEIFDGQTVQPLVSIIGSLALRLLKGLWHEWGIGNGSDMSGFVNRESRKSSECARSGSLNLGRGEPWLKVGQLLRRRPRIQRAGRTHI